MTHLTSDVLIVGAGGAGMYAAVAAAREGARVLLVDKSLIGRGGATIMAQMTVAAAVGEADPAHWTPHLWTTGLRSTRRCRTTRTCGGFTDTHSRSQCLCRHNFVVIDVFLIGHRHHDFRHS